MHHIIINPVAGRGRSRKILPELTALFETGGLPFKVHLTDAPLEARAIARGICAASDEPGGERGIIGIGGDGTLQEIVAGMADAYKGLAVFPAAFGFLPCGSGNDFALSLSKRRVKTEDLFKAVARNETRAIDIITETVSGDSYLNIANMGLDARIVKNAEPLRRVFGSNAYVAAALKSIAGHRNISIKVEVNGTVIDEPLALIAVCNGRYYGGGLHIAPSARTDDGKITVFIVKAMSRVKILTLFPSIFIGTHTKLREATTLTCEELSISWEGDGMLCMDGNLTNRKSPANFKILPGALRLYDC